MNLKRNYQTAIQVYIVTKCVNEACAADVRLADTFLRVTRHRQTKKDEEKREKVEARLKKLAGSSVSTLATAVGQDSEHQPPLDPSLMLCGSVGGAPGAATIAMAPQQYTDSSSSSSQFSSIPDLCSQSFQDDPRLSDPHLKKYFFRQRITSKSKHPNVHYQ